MSATIVLHRTKTTPNSTLGELNVFGKKIFSLEDPPQKHKIWGETRIPAGRYELKLRTKGGMHARYGKRFADMHKGMIWLQNVKYFEWVYLHIGNTSRDTEGCILVGMKRGDDAIYQSTLAYKLIYPKIVGAIIDKGCFLEIYDEPNRSLAA